MSEQERLRKDIRDLFRKRAKGDIREKAFQLALAERTVELYRAFVRQFLADGERILREHHVVFAHIRLAQSVLKEPEQQALSLFATDRRILRLRSVLMPDSPVTCDERDRTVVDDIPFDRIDSLKVGREIRKGELLAAIGTLAVAVLFYSWLAITGTLLVVLGLLGVLHSVFLPTRWVEIRSRDPESGADPIRIYALRKKGAKDFVRYLRERTAGSRESDEGSVAFPQGPG